MLINMKVKSKVRRRNRKCRWGRRRTDKMAAGSTAKAKKKKGREMSDFSRWWDGEIKGWRAAGARDSQSDWETVRERDEWMVMDKLERGALGFIQTESERV